MNQRLLSLCSRTFAWLCLLPILSLCTVVGCGSSNTCKSDKDCKQGFLCRESTPSTKVCIKNPCPTTCENNSDCGQCTEGKTTCTNNTCQKPEVVTCPATCSGDSDCAQCTDGKTTCKQSLCQKPDTNVCPGSCTQDSDCAQCTDGKTTCKNNTCQKPDTNVCPGSCTQDSDCAQCTEGKTTCKDNTCQKVEATTCPSTCSVDGDCAQCTEGKTTCKDSTCQKVEAPKAKLNESCASLECDTGLVCITLSNSKQLCYQDCTQDQSSCASNTDGRTKCVYFAVDENNQAVYLCLAEANPGEDCYLGTKQALCKEDAAAPHYCSAQDGKCKPATLQKNEGDDCNKPDDNTEPKKVCDQAASLSCNGQTGKCEKSTEVGEGEECEPEGYITGKIIKCKTGFDCIVYTDNTQRCHKICTVGGSGVCSHNTETTCLGPYFDNNQGLCLDNTCASDTECAFATYKCEDDGNGGKVCNPPSVKFGPNDYTKVCGYPITQKGCKEGFGCVYKPNTEAGFCSKECSDGSTCPEFTTAGGQKLTATCVSVNEYEKYCIFSCDSNAACPDGLSCVDQNGNKICQAP